MTTNDHTSLSPSRQPEARRNRNLRIKYGLSPEEFASILQRQNGRCAVCKGDDPSGTLAVDHDHATGQVRGLLCHQCNRALGLFRDNAEVLDKAAAYVERHRQMRLFGPAGPIK